ncbi:uncharacterized protein LOC111312707 [Durio zibethinus]|uniref:Uncharacterized protein LOC111312707 n=1 Tax=Durio zibethinus TaxID=66656 RepID=A0A6P6AVN2_DURZI|nr:uncharacterized protein LOC111312707 [Durio zibethinus]
MVKQLKSFFGVSYFLILRGRTICWTLLEFPPLESFSWSWSTLFRSICRQRNLGSNTSICGDKGEKQSKKKGLIYIFPCGMLKLQVGGYCCCGPSSSNCNEMSAIEYLK